jgi:hypothetical protein
MKTITILLLTFVISAGTQAKGILEFAYGYHFCNCLPVSDSLGMKSSPVFNESGIQNNGLLINATPNPAKTWVAFNYRLPVYASEAVLQVTDMKGNTVTAFTLTSKQGQQVWDIRDVEKGVYIYTLKIGTLSKSGKLIVK